MDVHKHKFAITLLAYAVHRGLDPKELCSHSNLDFAALKKGDPVNVTRRHLDLLWTHSVRRSGDPLFGLHFAESLQLAALGVVGKLIQSSSTVGEALTIGVSQSGLIYEEFSMKIVRARKTFTVHIVSSLEGESRPELPYKQMRDFLMVFLIHELDGLLFTKVQPISVNLGKEALYVESQTLAIGEYERLLRCKPKVSGNKFYVEFPIEYWDEPLITANPALQDFLIRNADQTPLPTDPTLKNRIQAYLNSNSYLGFQSLENVAANLNMSQRTLQRRLKDEGYTFNQVADEVRRNLALHYVKLKSYPLKEISTMLGYNETSAFSRAFKRWTGRSPIQF